MGALWVRISLSGTHALRRSRDTPHNSGEDLTEQVGPGQRLDHATGQGLGIIYQ